MAIGIVSICASGAGCSAEPVSAPRGFAVVAFDTPVSYPVPAAWGITAVDLNNDKVADLLVSSKISPFTMVGHGDGGFTASELKLLFGGVRPVAADINGDGLIDIVGYGEIRLGTGGGEFRGLLRFNPDAVGWPAQHIGVGDYNGDGSADLLFPKHVSFISLVPGGPDGRFASPQQIEVPTLQAELVASGDFNQDGIEDAAVGGNGGGIAILPGDKAVGAIHVASVEDANVSNDSLLAVDMDGDGALDLVSCQGEGKVGVFTGDRQGHFPHRRYHRAILGSNAVAVADFNQDGRLDVAVSTGWSAEFAVLLAMPDGGFAAPLVFPTPQHVHSEIAAADFNGDERPDIALTTSQYPPNLAQNPGDDSGTVEIFLNASR